MLERADDIVVLITKQMKNELSSEEKQRLEDWANESEVNRKFLDEMMNEDAFALTMIDLHQLKINSKRHQQSIQTKKVVELYPRRPNRFLYVAAASVILLMIFAGTYFLLTKQASKSETTQTNMDTPVVEIPPAGNKAILTLSNGNTISLSDVNNGTIAQDGKSIISKKQDGEIVYENTHPINTESLTFNSITTPRGGWYKVILPDGTKVCLNAQTVLKYPAAFTGKDRRVELSGEAYFEVKEDKTKPFRVMIAAAPGSKEHHEIKVLGTHFNVNAYQEEPQLITTLLEGKIKFTTGASTQHLAFRTLTPGQRVFVNDANELKVTNADDPAAAIAWVNGKFSFEKRDLTSVMRELARWYDVDVKYAGAVQEKRMITGEIDRTMPLSKLLHNLEKMGTTRFRFEGRTIWAQP